MGFLSRYWYRKAPRRMSPSPQPHPRVEPRVTAESSTYFTAASMDFWGTRTPLLRAARSAITWQTVTDMSESTALASYLQPPWSFWARRMNWTARSSFSRTRSLVCGSRLEP